MAVDASPGSVYARYEAIAGPNVYFSVQGLTEWLDANSKYKAGWKEHYHKRQYELPPNEEEALIKELDYELRAAHAAGLAKIQDMNIRPTCEHCGRPFTDKMMEARGAYERDKASLDETAAAAAVQKPGDERKSKESYF